MTDEIPQWALERAAELANKEAGWNCSAVDCVEDLYLGQAFARYIAQHEEPPVDPLLIEAREIAAKDAQTDFPEFANNIRDGECDDCAEMVLVLTALRRGIELGKAGAA